MDTYSYILKALKDGRPVSSTHLVTIGTLGVFGLGLSYVFPSLDAASYNNWPKLGVALSFITSLICLLAIPLGSRQDWSMHKTRLTLCMVLFSSCICQYEEHVFDSLQREGSFIPFANNMIDAWLPGFHCGNIQDCVFDNYNTKAYNTAGLWPLYLLMPFFFTTTPLYAVCACGVAVVNSLGHLASCVVMLNYCPGTASALLLVCPSAMYGAHLLCSHYFAGHPSVHVAAMAAGGFCHVAVGFTFLLVNILGLLPERVFPFFMYAIFSVDLGLVCRLFGGPTEKFIALKRAQKDEARQMREDGEDEHSSLL